MPTVKIIAIGVVASILAISGCSGSSSEQSQASGDGSTAAARTTQPVARAVPGTAQIRSHLLKLGDITEPGFALDSEKTSLDPTDTCANLTSADPQHSADVTFLGGTVGPLLFHDVRASATEAAAETVFKTFESQPTTCRSDGANYVVSPMSAPKLGTRSIGLQLKNAPTPSGSASDSLPLTLYEFLVQDGRIVELVAYASVMGALPTNFADVVKAAVDNAHDLS